MVNLNKTLKKAFSGAVVKIPRRFRKATGINAIIKRKPVERGRKLVRDRVDGFLGLNKKKRRKR